MGGRHAGATAPHLPHSQPLEAVAPQHRPPRTMLAALTAKTWPSGIA